MSGNAHQRKVAERAISSALKRMGITPNQGVAPTNPIIGDPPAQEGLGRSSFEAYAFFIMAGVYTVMSLFGQTVSFVVGCFMACVMAGCAVHLVWSSIWTANWNLVSRVMSLGIIVVTLGIVINSGYYQTHRPPNVSAELSATQTLTAYLKGELPKINPVVQNNTQVVELDGKYPDIELGEPREVSVPGGQPLVNVDEKNDGNATALSKRETGGLFLAPIGVQHEDAIFRYLYLREQDKGDVPSEDLAPLESGIIPIGGQILREDGRQVTDEDRRALFEKTDVLYAVALIGYQDKHGHIYHKELCYSYAEAQSLSRKCTRHNGHG
jgi:hypothetical protein